MPFSKYFQDDPPPTDHANNDALQFQLPSFIGSRAPTLAPGGGAEVLTFNSAWFANNNSSSNGYYTPFPPALSSPQHTISAPSPLGLPVYSASGFDILSVLARVASRPNPRVVLGPVDMTCSFVVVDIRRHDQPIVYCSPTFCRLTGYPEHEVLGRNCRFLQAPPSSGPVRAGEPRRFTSQASVDTMRKALVANKEVQTSIVNFRKDGSAFINLVSVIPILGGERGAPHELSDVVYHVGFQVDLTEQPNVILDKLRDGSYMQNTLTLGPAAPYNNDVHSLPEHDLPLPPPPPPQQRKQQLPALLMAPSLAQALTNPTLHRALPITTSTTAPSPLPSSALAAAVSSTTMSSANNPLSLILLEYAPDFILVVSLKGAFLYVAPAITHVLGHSPTALVGRSIADLAHPEDVVPLERQLKESSTLVNPVPLPGSPPTSPGEPHAGAPHAKLIDVLFRARTARGAYVWVEARGRLHIEPGKGRKAIVLSARARRMPRVRWGDLLPPLPAHTHALTQTQTHECWAQLSGMGAAAGAVVACGKGVERVLGRRAGDVLGRRVSVVVGGGEEGERVERVLGGIERGEAGARVVVFVRMRVGEEGEVDRVRLAFYPTRAGGEGDDGELGLGIAPPVVLLHIARGEGIDNLDVYPADAQLLHDPEENVFAELEVRRGSSWQYELQQMRFRNARLREEVRALEREVRAFEGREVGVEGAGVGAEAEAVAVGAECVVKGEVGNEGTEASTATMPMPMPMTKTGNPYPPPCYAEDVVALGNVEQESNTFAYADVQLQTEAAASHAQQQQQQQGQAYAQADYTAGLERYSDASAGAGAGYEGLEMALGVGMGMANAMTMDMGVGMSAGTYALPQQAEHRSSVHLAGMYAPRPVHSVSASVSVSGLMHALGPPVSSQHQSQHQSYAHLQHQHQSQAQHAHQQHQQQQQQQQQIQTQTQQQIQTQTQTHAQPSRHRSRVYDSRTQVGHHQPQLQGDAGHHRHDVGRRQRADSQSLGLAQWAGGVQMHPGVKRAFGGR